MGWSLTPKCSGVSDHPSAPSLEACAVAPPLLRKEGIGSTHPSIHAGRRKLQIDILVAHDKGSRDCGVAEHSDFETVAAGQQAGKFEAAVRWKIERGAQWAKNVNGSGTCGLKTP